jgi:hypothetical protein
MLILRIPKGKRPLLCCVLWSADITIMMFIAAALSRHLGLCA